MQQQVRDVIKNVVEATFLNDYGQPFVLTDGQADIFGSVFLQINNRVQIIGATQYGKSDTISMAVLLHAYVYDSTWAIIAGDQKKARIIMGRVIQHCFDNSAIVKSLEIDDSISLDRLRRERSKDNITFKGGGQIQAFTANTKNKNAVYTALSGFGSPNIIEDEAALIPNDAHAMIMRMLGGHKKNFLLKIGNPFYRNHFYKTSKTYDLITIDYKQALSEGRYSEEFIEEMKKEPFFDVLYECVFPDEDAFNREGYQRLFTDKLLAEAYITKEEAISQGFYENEKKDGLYLGCDYAGSGRDRSVYVLRSGQKYIELLEENVISDTMQQVIRTESIGKDRGVEDYNISIDYGGLGQGIGDRLKEKELYINCVMFGGSPPHNKQKSFLNMRAYMYFELLKFLKEGGKIITNKVFEELKYVYFKADTDSKLKLQPKEELVEYARNQGLNITSLDVADATALTFAQNLDVFDADIL